MPPLAPLASASDEVVIDHLHAAYLDVLGDYLADDSLLLGDAALRVDDVEAELVHQSIILVQHFALEQPEAFDRIRAPAQIQARLVELELDAARHQPVERHLDRHA